MYITRELELDIQPYLDRREVLTILGPRQAGKTTFMEHLAQEFEARGKKTRFITFENRADLALFNTDIDGFKSLAEQYDVVFIDEFQYATEGGQRLKYLYDTTRIKYIVSGSSSLDLVFKTGTYMVGRMLEFTLMPFSFREYLSVYENELYAMLVAHIPNGIHDSRAALGEELNRRLTRSLEEFVVFGGYPAVVLTKGYDEKRKILEGIAQNYLLKDIESLLHLATSDKLHILEKMLAGQIGNLITYNELSASSGLAYLELKKHLAILEQTYVISLIRPYHTNIRTEITKNPKIYFHDLGLRNYLLNDFRPLAERQDAGAIMENYAYTALARNGNTINFWRTKSGAEVDFIVNTTKGRIPYEVKYTNLLSFGKSVHSYLHKFAPPQFTLLSKYSTDTAMVGECAVVHTPLAYL